MARDIGAPPPRAASRPAPRSRPTPGLQMPPPPPVHGDSDELPPGTRPVGFWYRFSAYLIDASIVGTVFAVAMGGLLLFVGVPHEWTSLLRRLPISPATPAELAAARQASVPLLIAAAASWVAASWLYEALMTASTAGGTLGKAWLDMRVVRADGGRVGFVRATVRHLAKYVSWAILMLGCIMAAFHPRKRALHDLIAGTVVVYRA